MAEKFDEFSKHLARKQTRRGALKFMGAGLVSAFVATVFSRSVDADRARKSFLPLIFNSAGISTDLLHNREPQFNSTRNLRRRSFSFKFNSTR